MTKLFLVVAANTYVNVKCSPVSSLCLNYVSAYFERLKIAGNFNKMQLLRCPIECQLFHPKTVFIK